MTVATTGPNAPATHWLGVDPVRRARSSYSVDISSNGTVSKTLPAGQHTVNLVVLNCTVTSLEHRVGDPDFRGDHRSRIHGRLSSMRWVEMDTD